MIRERVQLVATCDVCRVQSEPFYGFRSKDPWGKDSVTEWKLPPPWIEGERWNQSWSSLLARHYCSKECANTEKHGLKKEAATSPE